MYVQLVLTIVVSILALIVAGIFARQVVSADTGTPKMQEVAAAIREGAEAFIKRQYSTIAILGIVVAVLIFVVYFIAGNFDYALHTSIAFAFGALCSGVAGIIGMWISVRANAGTSIRP